MDKALYQNFDRLRLPLMLLVVFIHARFMANGGDTASLYGVVSHFFTSVISQVAVPFFFFISGCLYFRNYSDFSINTYWKKQYRRLKTLVVPFLLWNTVFWLLFTGFKLVLPSFTNGGIPAITGASLQDVFWVYWGNPTGGPIDFPLWFIRDLITVTFLSPLLFFLLLKIKAGYISLIAIAILWVFACPIPFLGNNICSCVFFFSLGGYLNKLLSSENMLSGFRKILYGGGKLLIGFFFLLGIISTLNHYLWDNYIASYILNRLLILEGIVAMYCMVNNNSIFFEKVKDYISGDCVFFIYATHGFLITVIKRVIERLAIDSQVVLILLYFSIVFVTVMICVYLYRLLKAISPKTMTCLTGR